MVDGSWLRAWQISNDECWHTGVSTRPTGGLRIGGMPSPRGWGWFWRRGLGWSAACYEPAVRVAWARSMVQIQGAGARPRGEGFSDVRMIRHECPITQ